MSRISFPRKGYDGRERSQKQIEDWYWSEVGDAIMTRLLALRPATANEHIVVRYLLIYLKYILLGNPRQLETIKNRLLNRYQAEFASKTKESFNKQVQNAFGYDGYRKTVLTQLAKRLDIKTCPYCNAQYTLFLDVRRNQSYPKGIAKFQFDHFFNKSDSPFLSMSMYNLIPSCASCNLAKHHDDLPVELNPYESDIAAMYKFRLTQPYKMWTGAKMSDSVSVRLKPTDGRYVTLVDALNSSVNLSSQYGRHRDVAQELFERAYTYPYYSRRENFTHMLTTLDEQKFKRIWMGTYTEKEEIEKRPLTKFAQDMWEQANEELDY